MPPNGDLRAWSKGSTNGWVARHNRSAFYFLWSAELFESVDIFRAVMDVGYCGYTVAGVEETTGIAPSITEMLQLTDGRTDRLIIYCRNAVTCVEETT